MPNPELRKKIRARTWVGASAFESMRLMVLQAARAMDVLPMRQARIWVSAVKALVPRKVCDIIDDAIQMHGGLGVSQFTPLALMYTNIRTLRLADGPDEVHHMVVGRAEANSHEEDHAPEPMTWVRPG